MIILKTQRLLLRPLKQKDWPSIQYLRSDADVNKFVERPRAASRQEALDFIAKIHKAYSDMTSYYWVIQLKDDDKMIGSICLWNFSESRLKAEIGYDLMTAYHNRGIMTEALEQLIEYSFNTLRIQSLEAFTQFNNTASLSLLNKFGFVKHHDRIDSDNSKNVVYVLYNHKP